MTKPESIHNFDPNGPGIKGNIFGLPYSSEESELIIIPVPWEVTVSYHSGTAAGPKAILDASSQVDLCLKNIPDAWKYRMCMLPVSQNLLDESAKLRVFANKHIQAIESRNEMVTGGVIIEHINEACENLNFHIKTTAQKLIQQGKIVALVGGDHSTPLGLIRALSEKYNRFGILQIDAHADLRKGYEGFTYSHASVMHNALKLPSVGRLVQVGIRDYCDEEIEVMARSMGRVKTFFDQDIKEKMFGGETWDSITDAIIHELPELVYITFDIDGLDPKLCPGTGTPVPGGLEFDQAVHIVRKIVLSGRKIIGFDLSEVASSGGDWDANVGARLLYQLCVWTGVSEKRLEYKT
jgi:agmatinase